jgi:hypothetical protein
MWEFIWVYCNVFLNDSLVLLIIFFITVLVVLMVVLHGGNRRVANVVVDTMVVFACVVMVGIVSGFVNGDMVVGERW